MNTQAIISSINTIGGTKVCRFATQTAIEGQSAAVQASILHSLSVAAKHCDESDDHADEVIPAAARLAVKQVTAVHPEIDADHIFACLVLALTAATAAFFKGDLRLS